MEREQIDNWCGRGILGLVLAALVFGPLSAGAVGSFEFLVIQGLTLAAASLWVVRVWLQENYRLLFPPICWVVILFAGLAVFRSHDADLQYVARGELIQVLTYSLLFFIVLNNLHRQESAQLIGIVLICLAMALSVYAIFQFFTNTDYVWHLLHPERKPEQYMGRGSGTYICPNHFAGFVEIVVPLALAFMFKGRFHHATKVFFGYAALVMLAGIAVSVSRGGWLATGLALAILFSILVRYRDTRLPALVFLTLFAVGALFALRQGFQAQKRWSQFFRESGGVFDIRFYLWDPAVQIWKDHFWWGAGPGHFNERFAAYRPEIVQASPGWVHNDYLNTLADWGVVGAVLVLAAWVFLYWGAFKTWHFVRRANDIASKPSSRGALILWGGIGLSAVLFHALVDFNMHVPANALVTIVMMALVTGYLRFATERHWLSSRWWIRTLVTLVVLAGIGYLGQLGFVRFQEARHVAVADRLHLSIGRDTQTFQELDAPGAASLNWEQMTALSRKVVAETRKEVEALKLANQVEPSNFKTTYRIGQGLRSLSELTEGEESDGYLTEALQWFLKGIEINPFDPYNHLRAGMCLDGFRRYDEALEHFEKSMELDPKNYYVVALYGWHFFQVGDYAAAKRWFQESLRLSEWRLNLIAANYMILVDERLAAEFRAL